MLRTTTLALTLVAWTFATLGTAQAHETVASTTPSANEALPEGPEEVSMTFTAEPLDVGSSISVVDSAGETWSTGEVQRDAATLTQPLRTPMPAGSYEVRWRTVSSDGHPISGTFSFTVTATGTTDQPEPTNPQEPEPTSSEAANEGESSISFGILVLATLAVVVAGVAVRALIKNRRQRT